MPPALELQTAAGEVWEVRLLAVDENGQLVRLGLRQVDGPGYIFVINLHIDRVELPDR